MSIPVPTSTRDKLVFAAMELFTTKGFDATSIAEILARAGVNSGSLYYFFKTKDDLLLAGLDLFQVLVYPIVMEPAFTRETDPIEKIFAVLEDYRQRLVVTGLEYECPIGKLSLEVGRRSKAIREKIAANFAAWRSHIRRCLDEAGDRLPATLDHDSLASFILTTMEGAVMQARTHHDLALYDQSIQNLRNYFDMLMAQRAVGGAAKTSTTDTQRHREEP
jgi:TetR/AcrR family transcriptional regulator, transcriptional repressor for nem operon